LTYTPRPEPDVRTREQDPCGNLTYTPRPEPDVRASETVQAAVAAASGKSSSGASAAPRLVTPDSLNMDAFGILQEIFKTGFGKHCWEFW
jgi:hypothetical protein